MKIFNAVHDVSVHSWKVIILFSFLFSISQRSQIKKNLKILWGKSILIFYCNIIIVAVGLSLCFFYYIKFVLFLFSADILEVRWGWWNKATNQRVHLNLNSTLFCFLFPNAIVSHFNENSSWQWGVSLLWMSTITI